MSTDVHIFTSIVTVVCLFPSNWMVCYVLGYILSCAMKVKKLSRWQDRVIGSLRNLRCLVLREELTFFRAAFTVKTLNHIMPLIWFAFLQNISTYGTCAS